MVNTGATSMKTLWAPWRESYLKNPHVEECIFCKAVKNTDENQFVVYRSRYSIAMLNKYPYNSGHVMVAPVRHVPSIELLSDEELLDLSKTVTLIVKAIRECYKPDGINIGINIGRAAGAGIESHLHVHIVPRWNGDTNFMPVIAGAKVIPEDLHNTWIKIKHCIEKIKSG